MRGGSRRPRVPGACVPPLPDRGSCGAGCGHSGRARLPTDAAGTHRPVTHPAPLPAGRREPATATLLDPRTSMESTMLATPVDLDQLTGVWQIDPAHSEVGFCVRHLMTRLRGAFTRFSGTITVGDDPPLSSVRAEIDTASVDTRNSMRDKHLRATDFLDSDNHPTACFTSARIRTKDGRYLVDGALAIRGQVRRVTLDLFLLGVDTDVSGRTRAGFRAYTRISRSEFGVTGHVPVAGRRALIGDTVLLELEIQAVKDH
ncbi:YceI family protein [Streptomyces sp.]|uniref:YceI family protein n=1 Tax=Streptomyces sp. TaxID=1931 RepID=UPI0039C8F376